MNSNPITIVHVVLRFDIGGLEKVLIDTVNGLVDNYEHIIISLTTASPESRKMLPRKIKVIELNKKKGNDLALWLKLFRILRSTKPNILHTYNLPTLEYQVVGFLAGVPYRIHAEHGRNADDPHGLNKKYLLLRKLLQPFIHVWVPVSEDLYHWLIKKVKIPRSKIQLIYNGVDTSLFNAALRDQDNQQSNRLEGFATNHQFVVGTIGRLDPVKNQKILVKVFEAISKREPLKSKQIIFAIVGSGQLENELSNMIRSKGFEASIWLPGARYDIAKTLSDFDLFILPSIAEGIPMTLLEAMSMKIPVIASSVGGIPEVIGTNCGTLVPANDIEAIVATILHHINQPENGENMATNGLARIEQQFSQVGMVANYENLYRDPEK